MSKNKSYNSILFLTTLSVYLGLVLVGASPSVLAQQAVLTQKFEIQTEFEVEDDLDKNPDDEIKSLVHSVESYFDELNDFINDLQSLHHIQKFNLDYDRFRYEENGSVPCDFDGDPIRRAQIVEKIDNQWLKPLIIGAVDRFEGWDFLSDCLPTDKPPTGRATNAEIKLSYDKSELTVELSASKDSTQKAFLLAEKLNQANSLLLLDEEQVVVKQLYQNTIFKAENDQVFIITRLPRGSLDALFKSEN